MNVNIAQVRERLQRRRGELANRVERVRRDLERAGGALAADFSEQAVQTQNDEALEEIGRTAAMEMKNIDAALERIAIGEYGLCKHCGLPIEARRLIALPEAVACSKCRS